MDYATDTVYPAQSGANVSTADIHVHSLRSITADAHVRLRRQTRLCSRCQCSCWHLIEQ